MQMIFGSSAAPVADIDVLNLSGTALAPNSQAHAAVFPEQSNVEWLIGCVQVSSISVEKGQIQSDGWKGADARTYVSVDSGTDWEIPNDFSVNYWIRATLESGSAPTVSSGMDTWLTLAPGGANRAWRWSRSAQGTLTGVIKLEIATDSDGNDIVATGYYEGSPSVIVI